MNLDLELVILWDPGNKIVISTEVIFYIMKKPLKDFFLKIDSQNILFSE